MPVLGAALRHSHSFPRNYSSFHPLSIQSNALYNAFVLRLVYTSCMYRSTVAASDFNESNHLTRQYELTLSAPKKLTAVLLNSRVRSWTDKKTKVLCIYLFIYLTKATLHITATLTRIKQLRCNSIANTYKKTR